MDSTLSPRAVLLTMTFIVVSLVCQAAIHCIQLLHASVKMQNVKWLLPAIVLQLKLNNKEAGIA